MSLENEIIETKAKCKKRMQSWLGLVLCCNALIVSKVINYLMPFARVTGHFAAILEGIQYGFICGLILVAIYFMVYYTKGMRNDDFARKIYVRENDERIKLIKEKTGIRFYFINVICLAIAVIISGYFNHIVFFTLIGALIFQIVVVALSKIYWTKKLTVQDLS